MKSQPKQMKTQPKKLTLAEICGRKNDDLSEKIMISPEKNNDFIRKNKLVRKK